METNVENLVVTKENFLKALKFQMRNVARIDKELVVYKTSPEGVKSIVGVLADGEWKPVSADFAPQYDLTKLNEATDLTINEVKTYVNTRFKEEHENEAEVNDNIAVEIKDDKLIVTFPTNFVSYKGMDESNAYNVTAHLDYSNLFTGLEKKVEGVYSFKIKSYKNENAATTVLEKLSK